MTRSSLLLALACPLLALGCGQPSAPVASAAPVPAPAATPKPDPIAKGIPHGAQIMEVAITEDADAALTFDNLGELRLWPALDGSRAPVPVSAIAPHELALGHAGRDLLAAILDDAGSVRLLRLGRDGSLRGEVQLPADVAYKQLVAVDDGVLVRSDDQTIEWFSPDGESRGRLVADPARRIQTIAARRGQAVALVTDASNADDAGLHTTAELEWLLMMGGKLTWGAAMALPSGTKGELLALSPSHRRIAIVDDKTTANVYELGLVPVLLGNPVFANDAGKLGFYDDDHLAIIGSSMQWWVKPNKPAAPSNDPWAVAAMPSALPVPSTAQIASGGAVGDGMAVTPFGAALALTTDAKVQYLGYKEHGVGALGVGPTSLWVAMTGSHVIWLDDKLAIKREIELRQDPNGSWIYATPIGDHHLITQTPFEGKYKAELLDLDKPGQPKLLGTYTSVERVDFAPDTGLLGISVYSKIERFKLDLATDTVTNLPPLKTRGSLTSLRLLDPERTGGITAITLGWDQEYDEDYAMMVYRTQGKPKQVKPFRGRLIDIDDRGTVYTFTGEIQVRHGADKPKKVPVEHAGAAIAVSSDGSRFAVQADNQVIVIDATGAVQWRMPIWGVAQLLFTKNDKHVAVRANGGLLLLDAATGKRLAMECGWSFGLMTTPPVTNALASAPVCEDPMLQ